MYHSGIAKLFIMTASILIVPYRAKCKSNGLHKSQSQWIRIHPMQLLMIKNYHYCKSIIVLLKDHLLFKTLSSLTQVFFIDRFDEIQAPTLRHNLNVKLRKRNKCSLIQHQIDGEYPRESFLLLEGDQSNRLVTVQNVLSRTSLN